MAKRKGLSVEEKKNKILSIFHNSVNFNVFKHLLDDKKLCNINLIYTK